MNTRVESTTPPINTSFFNWLTTQHGWDTTRRVKQLLEVRRKITVSSTQRRFLLKCRTYDTRPKHIQRIGERLLNISVHSKTATRVLQNTIDNLAVRLLNLEIEDLHIHLSYLNNKLEKLLSTLRIDLPAVLLEQLVSHHDIIIDKFTVKLNVSFTNKFLGLKHRPSVESNFKAVLTPTTSSLNDRWLVNLTQVKIPEVVNDIVSLGPKFASPSDLDLSTITNVIKNVESSINIPSISEKHKNLIRNKLINNVDNFTRKNRHISIEDRLLAQKLNLTREFLRKNNNIFFTTADKGNVTVALNKDTYTHKMNSVFKDANTYSLVNRDPLPNLRKTSYRLLDRWNSSGFLSKQYHRNELTQTNTNLARAYGLPKIHKKDVPFRPIISTIGSPTYNISKFLSNLLLKSIPKPDSFIKHSWDLIDKLNCSTVPTDHILLSLDVTSLFTNIPLELVKTSLSYRYPHIAKYTTMPLSELLAGVTYLMENVYFQFDNQFYKQIFGTPMGSPVSPVLADIVMVDLERDCLSKLDFKPLFYFRYVDDIVLCIPEVYVDEVLRVFNGYHPRLQFTYEKELERKLSFLDIYIIRDESNKLITNWFRKPTFSGRFLNYNSAHPIAQKRGMVFNLVDRAISLSHPKFHVDNLKLVRQLLHDNNYLDSFVEPLITSRLRYLVNKNSLLKDSKFIITLTDTDLSTSVLAVVNTQCRSNNKRISLPYIKGFYERFGSSLKKFDLVPVPYINTNLRHFVTKGKDRLANKDQCNVVYKIQCNDCSASYVGETKRELKIRIREHKDNIKKDPSSLSVVSLHQLDFKHSLDWDNVSILDKEPVWFKRTTSEMLHINLQPNSLNKKEDTKKLHVPYSKLLTRLRSKSMS